MDKEKIISFLAFLNIQNTELEVLIKETEFDYTNVLLSLIAIKIAETPETVISWYEKY
jgi:hypothetical protein